MENEQTFILAPYVYTAIKENSFLLYNTLSGKYLKGYNAEIADILKEAIKSESFYMHKISKKESSNNFFKKIKKLYIGDIINSKYINNAVQSYPIKNIQHDVKRYNKNIDYMINDNIASYIHEISIYVNQTCYKSCKICKYAFTQHTHCYSSKVTTQLDTNLIFNFLRQERLSNLKRINILGGNIWLYNNLEELTNKIRSLYECEINYYSDIQNIIHKKNGIKGVNHVIQITIDNNSINHKYVNTKYIYYHFFVMSNKALEIVYKIIRDNSLKNYEIKPLFNGKNLKFIRNNVAINEKDIFEHTYSVKDLYRNATINTSSFGKITILPDGEIKTNINEKHFGNICNCYITNIVNKELYSGNSWLHTRDDIKKCKECLFKYFCPSISNLEIRIGTQNICNIDTKK